MNALDRGRNEGVVMQMNSADTGIQQAAMCFISDSDVLSSQEVSLCVYSAQSHPPPD